MLRVSIHRATASAYTQWHDMTHAGALLQPGSILSWTINFTNCNYNWQGKSICLINFNNVWPTSTSPYADNELALILTVNGTEHTVNNYYLSKYANQPISPNYDLAQSNYYNDTGANTVSLKNLGASPITVSPGEYGGIDVYRIYQSTPICDSECTVGCEVSCQSCNTCCDVCESCESCQVACESCLDSCYLCYTVYCCQMCYGPCVSCVECQACETPCDTACQPCQVCQPCEMCQPCETCQSPCQIICDNCQTCVDCQASVCCQSCIVPWYGGCQECETCQPAYS
jgi:hypothetical protein